MSHPSRSLHTTEPFRFSNRHTNSLTAAQTLLRPDVALQSAVQCRSPSTISPPVTAPHVCPLRIPPANPEAIFNACARSRPKGPPYTTRIAWEHAHPFRKRSTALETWLMIHAPQEQLTLTLSGGDGAQRNCRAVQRPVSPLRSYFVHARDPAPLSRRCERTIASSSPPDLGRLPRATRRLAVSGRTLLEPSGPSPLRCQLGL